MQVLLGVKPHTIPQDGSLPCPARILIRQDEATFIDLMIRRKPELAR